MWDLSQSFLKIRIDSFKIHMSKKEKLISYSPINNQEIAYSPEVTTDKEYEEIVQRSHTISDPTCSHDVPVRDTP